MKRLLAVVLLAILVGGCQRPVKMVLVYEIDTQADPDAATVDPETVARAVRARVYPNSVHVLDDGRIEVGLSDDDPAIVARMDRIIRALGTFELRVLANHVDHPELIELAAKSDSRRVHDEQGELLGWWVPVSPGKASTFEESPKVVLRERGTDDRRTKEVLVVNDDWGVNGSYLVRAKPSIDDRGLPCINFRFNDRGGRLMGGLTSDNCPDPITNFSRKLGIILNGTLHSAPNIHTTIRDSGVITGDFTQQQVEELATVLNAGSLPARLRKVDRRKVGGAQ